MTPQDCIIIPLTRGYLTVIDQIDSDLLDFMWYADTTRDNTYAKRNAIVNGRRTVIRLHRVIMSRILGRELLPVEKVDHKDLDELNNRRDNLRLATTAQNAHNRRAYKNNPTGYKGVSKHGNHYEAVITVNKKRVYLGSFPTPERAAIAYDIAALEHHGEYAHLNNPSFYQRHELAHWMD